MHTVLSVTERVNVGKEFLQLETSNVTCLCQIKLYLQSAPKMQMYPQKYHVTLDTLLAKLKGRVATKQNKWKWARVTLHRFLTIKISYNYIDKRSHYNSFHEDVVSR